MAGPPQLLQALACQAFSNRFRGDIARIEVVQKGWALAQKLSIWTYPEQDADAKLLERALGKLPD